MKQKEICYYGSVYGICCDEFPPFKIFEGKHEVYLPKDDDTIYVCNYCLQSYIIDDEEKIEDDDYDLSLIDRKSLDNWNAKRDERRANYLEKAKI